MIQYISPLSFLPADLSGSPTAKTLKLARQRLMAEFELAGTTTIQLDGREIGRNDVIRMFDELETGNESAYHMLVASDPVLLRFLTQHEMAAGASFSLKEETVTSDFVEWLSPYFAYAFKKATTRMFRDEQPEEFENLVLNPLWMTEADKWDAWGGVEVIMQAKLQEFQKVNDSKYATMDQKQRFGSYNAVWLVCNMPEDRFSKLINNYAFELMRLSITEFNTQKRDNAFALIGYARSLRVTNEMRRSLENKEEEMRDITKMNTRSSNWNGLKILLFVAYVFAQLATCNR